MKVVLTLAPGARGIRLESQAGVEAALGGALSAARTVLRGAGRSACAFLRLRVPGTRAFWNLRLCGSCLSGSCLSVPRLSVPCLSVPRLSVPRSAISHLSVRACRVRAHRVRARWAACPVRAGRGVRAAKPADAADRPSQGRPQAPGAASAARPAHRHHDEAAADVRTCAQAHALPRRLRFERRAGRRPSPTPFRGVAWAKPRRSRPRCLPRRYKAAARSAGAAARPIAVTATMASALSSPAWTR